MPPSVDETRGETIARRLKTIPVRLVGALVLTVLFLPLLVVALIVDLVRFATGRHPFMASRMLLIAWIYLVGESVAIIAFALVWLLAWGPNRQARLTSTTWRIQQAWTRSLFGPIRFFCRLRFRVEGDEVIEPAPLILLVRHASIIDNLLPSIVVAGPHRLNMRYILKRELLSDPGLDIGGKRLRNYFLRRDTGEQLERDNVRRLAEDLGPREGVLIFPEGTRFTPERRARAIEKIGERDPALAARAEQIEHLLPPRPGGVLALLEGAPGVDVVVLSHVGFDGLRLLSDIWRGALIGRDVRVRLTRIPRAVVPEDRDARVAWLYDTWEEVDRWVGTQLAEREAAAVVPSATPKTA